MISRVLRPFALAVALASPATAQDSMDGVLGHRVIDGWMQADGSYMAAIELTLAPGWKTYWRSPGDAGIPPTFDWTSARNVGDVEVHWPAPEVFWQSGMRSVGYENRVVLPISVMPQRPGRHVRLRGDMSLGVCADVCIPAHLSIDAALDAGDGARPPALVAALASLPYSADEAGLTRAVCRLTPTSDGIAVEAHLTLPAAGGQEEAVIEPPMPGIWVSDAIAARTGDTLAVRAEMVDYDRAAFSVDRSQIRITVIGSSYSVDVQGCTGG